MGNRAGFTAITGETGAGKSIIIGALQLLLGERADKSLVRTGAEMCMVEAIFHGNDFGKWNARFDESGIEPSEKRFNCETEPFTFRNKSTVYQWITHDARESKGAW